MNAKLANSQSTFMAQVLDEDAKVPAGWTRRHRAGMAVYRNAYRARLVDALHETYEHTARWVGEDAFAQAAAHHIITHPPSSWTLDDAGSGFPETLAELFAGDPEVPELAKLEWAIHRCFVASDAAPLDAAGFAQTTERFEGDDWASLKLQFLPGTIGFAIAHDIGKLWRALGENGGVNEGSPDYASDEPLYCLVWREAMKPVFMQVNQAEGDALAMMLEQASYGAMCDSLVAQMGEEPAIRLAGEMLGRWLHNGLIAGVSVNSEA